MSGRTHPRVVGRKVAANDRPSETAHERLPEHHAGVGEHPEELAGGHGSGVLDAELGRLEPAALTGRLTSESRLDAIADGRRQDLGPLPNRLRRDSDLGGGLRGPAEQLEGFGLGHAPHLKACFADLQTMIADRFGTLSHMPDFGTRLTKALALADKSQRELAEELGISVQAVGQVIAGKTKAMTAENTARAARFLRVDHLWLATGEGKPQVAPEISVSERESQLLADLRSIYLRAPMIYEQLMERIRTIAAGLAAVDAAMRGVVPEAPVGAPPSPSGFEASQPQSMIGGMSNFGGLDELPKPKTDHKPKRRHS